MMGTRPRRDRWLTVLLIGGLAVAAGCNAQGEPLAPVSGRVTVDGRPLTTGSVSLRPEASKGNASQHHPNGAIDGQGNFELYVPPSRKGAPLGWYRVVVTAYDDPQPGKPLKSFIATQYSDEKTTPLRVEVVAKPEPGRYDLKLTR